MDFKKGIIFLVLTVLLFSIASASAADMNETATTSTDEYESELSQIDEQEVTGQNENSELSQIDEQEVTSQNENSEVKSGNPGTFTELQMSIDENYGKTLILNKSYEYEEGFSIEGIEITGSITIDGQGCTIDAQGKARIFIVKSENVILKNIIFKNGKATGHGGAVYFGSTGNVTNCNFINNTASMNGGAVYCIWSAGDVTNCNFINNKATGENSLGGAIRMYSGTVTNCNFTNNTANDGGAVYLEYGDVTNCNFTNNNAASVDGGAVYFADTGDVTNCNFINNTANVDGGAVYFSGTGDVTNCNFTNNAASEWGGAVYFKEQGTVSNCNFTNNNASTGGAVYFDEYGDVTNCNFTNNTATEGAGGAVYFDGDGDVTNCNFTNNTANVGGAIYMALGSVENCNFVDNKATGTNSLGGAINIGSGTVTNCNFSNNTATEGAGGAVYFDGYGDVTNCNFTNNTADVDGGAVYFNSNGDVTNCNFTNNKATGTDSWGGAIRMSSGTVTNCNFTNNTATNGEGGAIRMGSGSVENCNFINNTATYGSAIWMSSGTVSNCNFTGNNVTNGGAVYFWNTGDVTNCNFINNTAGMNGGAIDMNSGTVSNCNFTGNTAYRGGAVYFQSTGTVANCNFVNNNATRGGAVYFVISGDVTNCNFIGNTATFGGAVYFVNSGDVTNCNFTGNNAAWGSAIYFEQWFSSDTPSISNSIFLDNGASVDYNTALNVTINENNITITFVGQNNHLNAIYSINDAQVTFSNVTYWGAKGKEIANSTRSGSNKEAGQNITIAVVVNDELVFNGVEVTDYNGTIVLNRAVEGDYCILARHNLDSYYTEAETILTNMPYYVNVMSQTTGNKTVNITAKSNFNEKDGKLRFILPNGTEISANYGAGGIWWAVYEFSNPGVYNVSASYSSGEVNVTEGTITILADVPIIVSDMIITFGDDAVVVVSVPEAINGQNITIAVNSSSKNATVKNGEANATFTNLAFGDYVIVVAYLGDELNSANSTTAKLTVNKATPKIEVQSYDATYPGDVVITVKSDIAGLYVVKVGDVSQNVTLEAGVEKNVTFTGLPINEDGYVVNVTNADLENCTASVNDTNIVKVMKASSYINTDGLITVYNSGGILFVTLTGVDGEPLAGRGIKVNITGKTYTIITNASGIAGLPINLKAGLHPAYVWFNGDSTYAPSENVSTSVEVYTDSRITGNKDLVKKQGGSEPFKVRALDKYGKPVGAYAKVKMTVAGKTYTVWTDAKGYASLPINLKVGKYKITTVYGGTTVTNTITVKK